MEDGDYFCRVPSPSPGSAGTPKTSVVPSESVDVEVLVIPDKTQDGETSNSGSSHHRGSSLSENRKEGKEKPDRRYKGETGRSSTFLKKVKSKI